jgi:hypothetical protein
MAEPLRFGEPARKIFHPQEEDESVAGFSVVPAPDFSFLDEKTVPKTPAAKSAAVSPDEDVPLESFGVDVKQFVPDDLRETPGFGSLQPVQAETDESSDEDSFDVEPSLPDYAELDEADDYREEDEDVQIAEAAEPEDVKPLDDDKEAVPFMFARFGANNDSVRDLSPEPSEAIVEDKNGVYSISKDLVITDVVQDPEFKKLVDSVLR